MVHPDTGDVVAVSDKVAFSISNDSGIGSIDPDASVIILNHFTYVLRIHEEKRQAVLPEIPPSPSTAAVIMVRKEEHP